MRELVEAQIVSMFGNAFSVMEGGVWMGTFPTPEAAKEYATMRRSRARRGVPLFCLTRGCVSDATVGNYCTEHTPGHIR